MSDRARSFNYPMPLWPVIHPEDLKPKTACAIFEGTVIAADGVAALQKIIEGTTTETTLAALGDVRFTADCEIGWNWGSL